MASMRDIAKLAGVSVASVSRILNNDETFSINEHTRQRVIEIANQMNYSKEKNQPHSREVGDQNTIAIITRHDRESERNDPYFMMIRNGIEKEAAKWRLKTIRAFSMREPQKDLAQLAKYGAVIIIGEMTSDALAEISQQNANIILVDNYSEAPSYDCIQTDFAQKTHQILTLLKDKGHENIAFVGGVASRVTISGEVVYDEQEIRAENYRQWMLLDKLEKFTTVLQGKWSPETGLHFGQQIAQMNPRPTAIVVASDPMAVGVYKALAEAGLSIPKDVSVVSFDDIEMAQFMTPALSSVKMKAEEMGQMSVELAKNKILGVRTMPVRVVCGSELIIRESIAEKDQ
ncbi:GalR protein [Enterococcus casseliflavus]|uniref:LacI family DNA-binding transcriptional regulator n=1 Tax=Enterococcus casseliflavus TaxID=37734 RepID=UPI000DFFC004|nr:LacI family DNA-binding transcriptional regulator [Enterococcus casseliflavus]GEB27261.1 putative HTH-type transcriptional regulator MsmR [Enterococcus casseliflavus]STP33941.1 GalR protein [Enterococcus casseliflavus]